MDRWVGDGKMDGWTEGLQKGGRMDRGLDDRFINVKEMN